MPSYPLIHKQISPLPRTPSPFAAASVTLLLHCQGGSKTDRRFGSLSDRRAHKMQNHDSPFRRRYVDPSGDSSLGSDPQLPKLAGRSA